MARRRHSGHSVRVRSETGSDEGWAAARWLGASIHTLGGDDLLVHHAIEYETEDDDEGDARVYADSSGSGLSFIADLGDGLVHTVHLYAEGHQDHRAFAGALPGRLHFGDDRASVRGRLGQPARSGESQEIHPFGRMPAWDAYDFPEAVLHVEYTLDESGIRLITLMSATP